MIGREQLTINHKHFPHILSLILIKASKELPKKTQDLLAETINLSLQPVCNLGFACQNCKKN